MNTMRAINANHSSCQFQFNLCTLVDFSVSIYHMPSQLTPRDLSFSCLPPRSRNPHPNFSDSLWQKSMTSLIPYSYWISVLKYVGFRMSLARWWRCLKKLYQYSHLITRRCREHHVYAELMPCTAQIKDLKFRPKGIKELCIIFDSV